MQSSTRNKYSRLTGFVCATSFSQVVQEMLQTRMSQVRWQGSWTMTDGVRKCSECRDLLVRHAICSLQVAVGGAGDGSVARLAVQSQYRMEGVPGIP